MNPPATLLILGARGRLGAQATQAFAAAGWRVLAQARSAPALPQGAEHLPLSLEQTDALVQAARGASAVLYAVNPPYTRWAEEALPLARHGMAVAERLGARFMLPGNVYGYGRAMPALLREDTPMRPDTRKGRLRVAMEAEIEARCAQGLRAVILRAGDFFGAGQGTWLELAIAKSIGRGRLVYPGPLDRPHAWAYLPDLAQAFVAAAAAPSLPAFARLHFAGHTLTGADLLAGLERAAAGLGLSPAGGWRHGGMPWWLLRLGGRVVPMWREVAEMAYLWEVPHALDGAAMAQALGPLPHTGLDAALRASLNHLGGHAQPHPPRGQAANGGQGERR